MNSRTCRVFLVGLSIYPMIISLFHGLITLFRIVILLNFAYQIWSSMPMSPIPHQLLLLDAPMGQSPYPGKVSAHDMPRQSTVMESVLSFSRPDPLRKLSGHWFSIWARKAAMEKKHACVLLPRWKVTKTSESSRKSLQVLDSMRSVFPHPDTIYMLTKDGMSPHSRSRFLFFSPQDPKTDRNGNLSRAFQSRRTPLIQFFPRLLPLLSIHR